MSKQPTKKFKSNKNWMFSEVIEIDHEEDDNTIREDLTLNKRTKNYSGATCVVKDQTQKNYPTTLKGNNLNSEDLPSINEKNDTILIISKPLRDMVQNLACTEQKFVIEDVDVKLSLKRFQAIPSALEISIIQRENLKASRNKEIESLLMKLPPGTTIRRSVPDEI